MIIMASAALLATGCDFFRALAGRPTSKDIEAKREMIERQKVERPGKDDHSVDTARSGSPVEPGMTETEPEKTEATGPSTNQHAQAGSGSGTKAKKRYYVIMGAFSSRENADRYVSKLRDRGYDPEFFGFTEGRTAVGVGGTDDEQEAKEFMKELKRQDFCPDGVWILDRKRK